MPRFPQLLSLLVMTAALGVASSPIQLRAQSVERALVVTALDRDRAPVSDLQPEDLIIREDGTRREVLRVGPDPDPRQIALLVDTSAAMAPAVRDVREAVRAFIEQLDGRHEISLISFGGPPRILVPSTRDLAKLHDGIGQIFAQPGSAAYLLDALRETTAGFDKRQVDRPVIVVLGGEGQDHSHSDASSVIDRLEEAAVAVHTVVLRQSAAATSPFVQSSGLSRFDVGPFAQWRLDRDRGLNQAPRVSGGSRRDLLTGTGAAAAMRELAIELGGQYLVVYARPDTTVPPRTIELASARDGLSVRHTPIGSHR